MALMKYVYLIIASVFVVAGLSACATSPTASQPPVAKTALAPQTLAPQQCGLFVWTADTARRFILFSQSQSQSAQYFDGTADITLSITQQSGRQRDGQFPQQTFDNGLSLSLRAPDPIDNGTRYRGGTLTGTDAMGWDVVQPVVGLSTCQT